MEVAQLVEQMEYVQAMMRPTGDTMMLHFDEEIGQQIERRKYVHF